MRRGGKSCSPFILARVGTRVGPARSRSGRESGPDPARLWASGGGRTGRERGGAMNLALPSSLPFWTKSFENARDPRKGGWNGASERRVDPQRVRGLFEGGHGNPSERNLRFRRQVPRPWQEPDLWRLRWHRRGARFLREDFRAHRGDVPGRAARRAG